MMRGNESLPSAAAQWTPPMAGAAGNENYNAAGNSDFSRKAMELAEGVIERSMWAAPQARDHFPPHSPERIAAMKAQGHGMRNLNDEAATWEAPSVAVTNGSRLTRSGDRANELLLTGQANEASEKWSSPKASDPEKAGPNMRGSKGDVPLLGQAAQWPGPAARDHKGANSADHLLVSTGSCHLDQLPNFVEHCFHPPSSPAPAIAAGAMSSTDSPNSNQPSVKRKLNPIFVEALMRWPTGLSGFERLAMAWTRWLLLMRSLLSELCSSVTPQEPKQITLFGGPSK